MVGFKTVGADEGTGTSWLDFRVALLVSWTPTANTLISIAFLASGDDPTMVIVSTLLNVTFFSYKVIAFQMDINRLGPGAI